MILDSGATQHIFKNNTYFDSYSPCVMHIIVANGGQVDGIGVGSIGSLYPVYHTPAFKLYLISISKLVQLGYDVSFNDDVIASSLYDKNIKIDIGSKKLNGLFYASKNILTINI